MTRKITISVPDDVAERLDREPNVSAYMTEAVRRRMAVEHTRQALSSVGLAVSDEEIERADERMAALQAAITPELRAEAEKLRARIKSRRRWDID